MRSPATNRWTRLVGMETLPKKPSLHCFRARLPLFLPEKRWGMSNKLCIQAQPCHVQIHPWRTESRLGCNISEWPRYLHWSSANSREDEGPSVANLSVVDDIRPPWSLKDVTARIGLTRIWHLEATLYRWNLCACPWSCSVALQVFNKTNPSFQQAKNHGRSLHPEEWACTLLLPFALHRQCSRKLVACVAPAEKWGCRCPILTSICAHQPWKYWTGVRARRTYSGTTVLILS